jgi:hypothetical protein
MREVSLDDCREAVEVVGASGKTPLPRQTVSQCDDSLGFSVHNLEAFVAPKRSGAAELTAELLSRMMLSAAPANIAVSPIALHKAVNSSDAPFAIDWARIIDMAVRHHRRQGVLSARRVANQVQRNPPPLLASPRRPTSTRGPRTPRLPAPPLTARKAPTSATHPPWSQHASGYSDCFDRVLVNAANVTVEEQRIASAQKERRHRRSAQPGTRGIACGSAVHVARGQTGRGAILVDMSHLLGANHGFTTAPYLSGGVGVSGQTPRSVAEAGAPRAEHRGLPSVRTINAASGRVDESVYRVIEYLERVC